MRAAPSGPESFPTPPRCRFAALIVIASFSAAHAQLIPGNGTGLSTDANTVALFRFEDSAATAVDSTANARHATVTGTTSGTGLFNTGRNFNGTSDRLEFGAVYSALSGASAWTIEYFARSAGGSQAPYLMSGNDNGGFYLGPGNGSIAYGIKTSSSGGSWLFLTSATAPAMDTSWHYYALTWSGSSLSVYRDGTLLESTATSGSWWGGNTYGLNLDYDPYAGGSYGPAGTVDDIRFSNVARTAAEIQNAYNAAAIPEPAANAALAGLCVLGLAAWRRLPSCRKKPGR